VAITVVSTVVSASADEVWQHLGDFAMWHTWLPRIEATEMDAGQEAAPVGSVRTLLLSDGSSVRERLLAKDDVARTLSYDFVGPHSFPVRRYVGRIRVEEITTSGATYVNWSGDFDSDAADEAKAAGIFSTIYGSFLTALQQHFDDAAVPASS
jgi:hypothetical protein